MTGGSLLDALRRLVEVETPTGDDEALHRGFELLADLVVERTGRRAHVGRERGVPFLHLAPLVSPSVLVVGHLDTVWPLGTLAEIPFAARDGVVTGPGVFDMKAGLAIALEAFALCAERDHVGLLVTGDEEIGSPTGRGLVERFATTVDAVVVPEPAAEGGGLKAARKGVGMYELRLRGRAAHAGLEPHLGANTTLELAALVHDLVRLEQPDRGTTVTPTVASSGTTLNTVPELGVLHVDVRAWTPDELVRVDQAVRGRRPSTDGVAVEVIGGINRPPLQASGAAALVALAQAAAMEVGLGTLEAVAVGGGSDGNFSAALGIPTLDGAGAVGGGAHARDEWVDQTCLEPRARWLARLFERVAAGDLSPSVPTVSQPSG